METTEQNKTTTKSGAPQNAVEENLNTKSKKQFLANNKLTIVAVAGVVVLVGAAFLFANQSSAEKAVARVNGEEIKQKELDARVTQLQAQQQNGRADEQHLQQTALDQLIGQKLFEQEAKKADLSATQEEVDEQLEQISSQFETPEQYQQALTTNGITEKELKVSIEQEILVQKYLEIEISEESTRPTEEEVQQLYDNFAAQSDDAPPLEDLRLQIEQQIQSNNFNEQVLALLETLKAQSEIEILI